MHVQVKGQILGAGQRQTGSGEPFDGRFVGQVQKKHGSLQCSRVSEIFDEKVGLLKGDPHGPEHDGELFLFAQHRRLPRDLGGDPRMWQPASGKKRQLLAPDQGIHAVDG